MNDLAQRIAELGRDRHSGASEILPRVIALLRQSLPRPAAERLRIAGAICRAQPAMASIWNAALAATGERRYARFERFVHRVERAPAALKRFATQLFLEADGPHGHRTRGPVSLVTVSSSASLRHVRDVLHITKRVLVAA